MGCPPDKRIEITPMVIETLLMKPPIMSFSTIFEFFHHSLPEGYLQKEKRLLKNS